MKSVSSDYIIKEEAFERKPVELYHLWMGTTHWRYTSGDVEVEYGGNPYLPATIKRGQVEYNSNLEVSQLQIQFAHITEPIIDYIAMNPVELVWVEVLKLFRDQTPLEASAVFIGQIKSVSLKGVSAQATCVGFEFFLKQPVPQLRYQAKCNWRLFDSKCGKTSTGYTDMTTVSVSEDRLTLTSTAFGARGDDYFAWGYVVFDEYKRLIVEHTGNDIKIRFKIPGVITGSEVTAYAGCDGSVFTCENKFNNLNSFGGFPYMPLDNPCTWAK